MGVLEAMVLGCPVVASSVDGVPEIIQDGTNGHIVPPGDIAALTQALKELSVDPKLRQRLGAAGKARVEQSFTAKRMARRVRELYHRCLR